MYPFDSLTKFGRIIFICMQLSRKQKTCVVESSLEASTMTIANSKFVDTLRGALSVAVDIEDK